MERRAASADSTLIPPSFLGAGSETMVCWAARVGGARAMESKTGVTDRRVIHLDEVQSRYRRDAPREQYCARVQSVI
jgi:hypothetical protein